MNRMVNGTDADISKYPWYCYLTFGCGGSLVKIENNVGTIITAAHCVANLSSFVDKAGNFLNISHHKAIFNLTRFLDPHNDDGAVQYYITKIFMHPHYNSQTIENDIAFVQVMMETPPPNITTLPRFHPVEQVLEPGMQLHVLGYGYADNLVISRNTMFKNKVQKGTVVTLDHSFYNSTYSYKTHNKIIEEELYVGGIGDKKVKLSPGDSGSPAFYMKNDQPVIAAVCSYGQTMIGHKGIEINNVNIPTVYYKVYQYADVMDSILTTNEGWKNKNTITVVSMADFQYQPYEETKEIFKNKLQLTRYLIKQQAIFNKTNNYFLHYSTPFFLLSNALNYTPLTYESFNTMKLIHEMIANFVSYFVPSNLIKINFQYMPELLTAVCYMFLFATRIHLSPSLVKNSVYYILSYSFRILPVLGLLMIQYLSSYESMLYT